MKRRRCPGRRRRLDYKRSCSGALSVESRVLDHNWLGLGVGDHSWFGSASCMAVGCEVAVLTESSTVGWVVGGRVVFGEVS